MNIVTVYPIIRGAFKDELTYWSSHSFRLGTIIEVPLRGRHIPALVGSVTPASHAKSNIKQASFVTRKIEKQKELQVVNRDCIKACEKMSVYYAVPLGSVLKACIPDSILQTTLQNTQEDALQDLERQQNSLGVASDVLAYQTNTVDRLSTYKSIVREEFARKRSMLIVAPTAISAEELFLNLQKGIEDYVIVLHGGLSKKKQIERWTAALKNDHPVLIIATPLFASIPKNDIQTIVVERESSRAYGSFRPPFIDYRDYMEQYARGLGARLIFGDTLLRIETLYRREKGDISDFFPISYRVEKSAELVIVDTSSAARKNKNAGGAATEKTGAEKSGNEKADEQAEGGNGGKAIGSKAQEKNSLEQAKDARGEKKTFSVMSEELHSMIEYAEKKSEPIFIFTARRGLSPQTVCGDCGQTVLCEICKAPIVLHQKKYVSHPAVHASSHANVQTQSAAHGYGSSPTANAHPQREAQSSASAQPSMHPDEYDGHSTDEHHRHSHSERAHTDANAALGINANRFFLCHHCGTERGAIEACTACGSWKLVTLGIGLETVAEEIKKQFPKREIFRLDKDSVKTDKQALTMVAEFKNSKNGILLGTESSLAYLPEVTYSAIASLDSLFSIPDFKIHERIAHTMLRILEKTSGYVLIQTRNPANQVLKHIESGNLLSMYREEIAVRKMLQYPPFITHIKITVEDTKSAATEKMSRLQQILDEWEAKKENGMHSLIFPAFVPTARGKSTLHMLLSVPKSVWPEEHLRSILASLPKEYIVRVNPESLL